MKDPKQLQNYVEEAMESESYHSSEDKENTVYEEFVPNWFYIVFIMSM